MNRRFFSMTIALAVLLVVITSCDGVDKSDKSPIEVQKEAVLSALSKNSNLSEYAAKLKDFDFSEIQADKFTFFAVTNDGMRKLASSSPESDGISIKNSIVAGKYGKSALRNVSQLQSLDGSTLPIIEIAACRQIYINSVEIGEEISVGNSTVYIVEKMIPSRILNSADDGHEKVQLLQTVNYGSGDSHHYEYDDQNRITKIIRYSCSNIETESFTYDGDNLVRHILVSHGYFSIVSDYEISGNKITMTRKGYTGPDEPVFGDLFDIKSDNPYTDTYNWTDINTLYLNNDGYPIQMGGGSFANSTFQYQDGNLITHTTEDGLVGDLINKYKYDNNKSLFINCKTPKWFMFWAKETFAGVYGSRNNIIESSLWDGNKVEHMYIYDSAGFPIKHLIRVNCKEDNEDCNYWVYETYEYVYN